MKPFDKKLGENVRKVFQNYHETVDEKAWKQMERRLKERSKKGIFAITPLFMKTAAAIALLLVVSGSVWMLVLNLEKPDITATYEVREDPPLVPAEGDGGKNSVITSEGAGEKSSEITSEGAGENNSVITPEGPGGTSSEITSEGAGEKSSVLTGRDELTAVGSPERADGKIRTGEEQPPATATVTQQPALNEEQPPLSAVITQQQIQDENKSPATSKATQRQTEDQNQSLATSIATQRKTQDEDQSLATSIATYQPAESERTSQGFTVIPAPSSKLPILSAISGLTSQGVISDLMPLEQLSADADEYIIRRNLEILEGMEVGTQRTSIVEVSAGSMKTWSSQEIARGMGYIAGVSGDWGIGRRMSIHGGGLFVYNQFNLESTLISPDSFSGREYAAAPNNDLGAGYKVLQYQASDTDIEFTALDIPVNLRFTLKEASGSRIFLSAGFSSFLYLQQKYSSESTVLATYHRINPQGHYSSETGSVNLSSDGEFNSFGRFDFARFLNLSAGYVIRGRNHSMIIEPFLKYPLGDVTTLNLDIGMAGFSLKYIPGSR